MAIKTFRIINQKFREKRFLHFKGFLKTIPSDKVMRILDIGGTQNYWESMNFGINDAVEITLLNLNLAPTKYSNFFSVIGDATDLSKYSDKHFDLVFSNSVIEHLFTKEAQLQMAKESRRVGKSYYIQTPNYFFPVEPHWEFPFFQFLPFRLKVALTKNLKLGHFPKAITMEAAVIRVKEVKLLTPKEMKKLFPEGFIYRERFLGITKSITMYFSGT